MATVTSVAWTVLPCSRGKTTEHRPWALPSSPHMHSGTAKSSINLTVAFESPELTHSYGQSSPLSHAIISPYETFWHRQYLGSFGSIGISSVGFCTTAGSGSATKMIQLLYALLPR